MKKSKSLILLLSSILLCAFSESSEAKKYEGRLQVGTWTQGWNDTLKASVHTDFFLGHKKDGTAESICDGYKKSPNKRKLFWHQLFVTLAYKESLHGPTNYILFNGGINKGLYQVNPELKSAYGCSGDLYEAVTNIKCASKMAKKLTKKAGSFLSGKKGGMAAYWQPLRATNKLNRKNRAFILDFVTNACKTGKITYHTTNKKLVSDRELIALDADTGFNDISDLPSEDLDLIMLNPLAFRPYTPEEAEQEWLRTQEPQVIDDLKYYPLEKEQLLIHGI